MELKRRLNWFKEFASKIEEIKGSPVNLNKIEKVELTRTIDLWMLNQLNLRIKNATEALGKYSKQEKLYKNHFSFLKDIDHYMYRTKHLTDSKDPAMIFVLSTVLESWLRLLAPFTPHT